jgi:pimeloyl-ACP methyl ester carboxylesterase
MQSPPPDSVGYFESFDGTRIAYETYGQSPAQSGSLGEQAEGVPSVVCLNGIACVAHAYWDPLVDCLRDLTQVVLWDYRGHGKSAVPANPAEIAVPSFARDLLALEDTLGIEKPVLVGHSFGVQVALEAVRIDQKAASGIVAVAGPHRRPLSDLFGLPIARFMVSVLEPIADTMPFAARSLWEAGFGSPLPYLIGRITRMAGPRATAENMRTYFEGLRQMDPVLLLKMFKTMDYQDARDFLPRLPVPLLAIAGAEDVMTPLPVMQELATLARDARLEVVKGAGHTLPIEAPEKLCELVRDFLGQVRAMAVADKAHNEAAN